MSMDVYRMFRFLFTQMNPILNGFAAEIRHTKYFKMSTCVSRWLDAKI